VRLHRLVQGLSPWSPVESVRLVTVALLGMAAIVVGWYGAADEPSFHRQTRWLVIATAGFIVMGYAAVSWVMRARSSVLHRRQLLLPLPAGGAVLVVSLVSVPAEVVVVGPAPGRYHRPGCPLVRGRDWPHVRRSDADLADRSACGVCRP
jgi:peptidoglycan/LPS O-acetylase OafA/YrhL